MLKKGKCFEYLRKTFSKENCVLSMYSRKDKRSNKRNLWPSVIVVQKNWKKNMVFYVSRSPHK